MADSPFVGPTYPVGSKLTSVARTVNMIPRAVETGNEGHSWVFQDVSGLVNVNPTVAPSIYVPCQLLLHYNEAATTSVLDYSTIHRAMAYVPIGISTITAGSAGEFGNAFSFVQQYPGSGSAHLDSFAYLTAAGDMNPGLQEFFMQAWVNVPVLLDNASSFQYTILSNRIGHYPDIAGYELSLAYVGGNTVPSFRAAVSTDGGATISTGRSVQGSAGIAANTWTHVAVSRYNDPAQNRFNLFLNGVLVNSTSVGNTEMVFPSALGYTRVGADDFSTTLGAVQTISGYHGLMDEVYVNFGTGTGIDVNFTPPTGPFVSTKTLRQQIGLDP